MYHLQITTSLLHKNASLFKAPQLLIWNVEAYMYLNVLVEMQLLCFFENMLIPMSFLNYKFMSFSTPLKKALPLNIQYMYMLYASCMQQTDLIKQSTYFFVTELYNEKACSTVQFTSNNIIIYYWTPFSTWRRTVNKLLHTNHVRN